MSEYAGEEETPTWEAWRSSLIDGYNQATVGDRSWIVVGEWLINAKENNVYDKQNVAYHVCKGNYNKTYYRSSSTQRHQMKSGIADIEDGCLICKTPMPDGIKMVALLEKL